MAKVIRRTAGVLLAIIWLLSPASLRAETAGEDGGVSLRLIPDSPVRITNAILHYICFDAEVKNAEKLTIRVYKPSGEPARFRTRKHVDENKKAVQTVQYGIRNGQNRMEDLNILFRSECETGTWKIEVTAANGKKQKAVRTLEVEVREPDPLEMGQLEEVHSQMRGETGGEPITAEEGKIRFVAQDPADPSYVRDYWLSMKFDLRKGSKGMCTRACFSMALSYLGIDCTPVAMSDLCWSESIFYTYDAVCKKLGNVERTAGDLETLWESYSAGEGSPVMIHFTYENGGMHAVLAVSRDRLNPDLYYCVTSGQPADTSSWPDGRARDHVIPVLIEDGNIGQWIQSPLLKRYHKGRIDQIWQWKRTDIP